MLSSNEALTCVCVLPMLLNQVCHCSGISINISILLDKDSPVTIHGGKVSQNNEHLQHHCWMRELSHFKSKIVAIAMFTSACEPTVVFVVQQLAFFLIKNIFGRWSQSPWGGYMLSGVNM